MSPLLRIIPEQNEAALAFAWTQQVRSEGRKRRVNPADVLRLRQEGLTTVAIAQQIGCTNGRVSQILKEFT